MLCKINLRIANIRCHPKEIRVLGANIGFQTCLKLCSAEFSVTRNTKSTEHVYFHPFCLCSLCLSLYLSPICPIFTLPSWNALFPARPNKAVILFVPRKIWFSKYNLSLSSQRRSSYYWRESTRSLPTSWLSCASRGARDQHQRRLASLMQNDGVTVDWTWIDYVLSVVFLCILRELESWHAATGWYLWTPFSSICPHACLQLLPFRETVIRQDSFSFLLVFSSNAARGQPSHHLSFLPGLLWGSCEKTFFFSTLALL